MKSYNEAVNDFNQEKDFYKDFKLIYERVINQIEQLNIEKNSSCMGRVGMEEQRKYYVVRATFHNAFIRYREIKLQQNSLLFLIKILVTSLNKLDDNDLENRVKILTEIEEYKREVNQLLKGEKRVLKVFYRYIQNQEDLKKVLYVLEKEQFNIPSKILYKLENIEKLLNNLIDNYA